MAGALPMTEEDEAQFLLDNLMAYAEPVQAENRARASLDPYEAESAYGGTAPLSPIDYSSPDETEPERQDRAVDVQNDARLTAALARGQRTTDALRARTPMRGENVMAGAGSVLDIPRGIATQVVPHVAERGASALGASDETADFLGNLIGGAAERAVAPGDQAGRWLSSEPVRRVVRGDERAPSTSPLATAYDALTTRYTPEGVSSALAQTLTLSAADEIAAATGVTDLETARRRRDAAEQDVSGSNFGTLLGLGAMAAAPGAASIPALARMQGVGGTLARGGATVAENAGLGYLSGIFGSDAEPGSEERSAAGRRNAFIGGGAATALSALPLLPAGYRAVRGLASETPERMMRGAAQFNEYLGNQPAGTADVVSRFLANDGVEASRAAAPAAGAPYRAPGAAAPPPRAATTPDDVIRASEDRVARLRPSQLRAAALRGENAETRAAVDGQLSSSIDNLFRLGDEVEESVGRLQMKESAIRRLMAESPPPATQRGGGVAGAPRAGTMAAMEAPAVAVDAARVAQSVDEQLRAMAEGQGIVLSPMQRRELSRLVDVVSTSDDAAASFMALDSLKRQVGRLRELAARGRIGPNSSAFADDLEEVYATLRRHLEDDNVWGAGAAGMQREMNAAFTPMIPARRALERFTTEDPDRRAVNGWDQARRADRHALGTVVDNANSGRFQNERADLIRGAQLYSDWAETMQRLHQGDTATARQMQAEAQRMLAAIDRLQTDVRASQMLQEAAGGVGRLGGSRFGIDLPQMVRLLQRFSDNPRATASTRGGRIFAEMWPQLQTAVSRVAATSGHSDAGANDARTPDADELEALRALPMAEEEPPARTPDEDELEALRALPEI
jgi:hypothetical protein